MLRLTDLVNVFIDLGNNLRQRSSRLYKENDQLTCVDSKMSP